MSEDSRPAAGPAADPLGDTSELPAATAPGGPGGGSEGDGHGGGDGGGGGSRGGGAGGGTGGGAGAGGSSGATRWDPAADQSQAVSVGRFWSGRRLPSALTAAVVLGLAGVFLYDVASVRSGRKALSWRKDVADELATRHLDDTWILLGASVAAALGLWLLVLAATPGERGVLPMTRRGSEGVRAGLDRHAAALVLRDRAMEVAGVRWARISVGRRRIKARAASHFRDIADVQDDLTRALDDAVLQLGLARPPLLRVRVRPADKKA